MSSTNRGRLAYILQTDRTVWPTSGALQTLRMTSADLAYSKQTTESNELESSGMTIDAPKTGASSAGSLNIEFSPDSYNDWIQAALRGTWGNTVNVTGAHGIVASTRTITAASSAFASAVEGQWVFLSGFANATNNGWFEIESITSDTVAVLVDPGSLLVDETGPGTAKILSKRLINGTVTRDFAIEEALLDVESFLQFLGQRVNTMNLSLSAGQVVTGSFGLMGSDVNHEQGDIAFTGTVSVTAATRTISATGAFTNAEVGQRVTITGMVNDGNNITGVIATNADADTITLTSATTTLVDEASTTGVQIYVSAPTWSSGNSYTAATSTDVFNATSNVGQIVVNNAVSTACFRSMSLALTNNIRETPCMASEFPSLDYGQQGITGTLEKIFTDLSDLWTLMKNHTDVELQFGLKSSDGTKGIHIRLPRVKLTSDQVDLSAGKNADVVDNVAFSALRYDDTAGSGDQFHIQICVTP
jgi:hypothetical protein